MPYKTRILITFITIIFALTTNIIKADEPPAEGMLPPTDILYLSFKSMAENPTMGRIEQVGKYYGRVTTENLNEAEKFALGEVHFINLKPNEALASFEPFMGGDDLRARIAWQRVMQIRFRAFNETDRVEKMIEEYKQKFEPNGMDVWDIDRQILNIATKYQKAGEYQKVVNLITNAIERLSGNAPYMTYRMPAQFMKSFEETGNVELAEKMMLDVQNKLKNVVAAYVKENPEGHVFYKAADYVPGREYRMEEGLLGYTFDEGYPNPELRFHQYNLIINDLDGALWRIRIEK